MGDAEGMDDDGPEPTAEEMQMAAQFMQQANAQAVAEGRAPDYPEPAGGVAPAPLFPQGIPGLPGSQPAAAPAEGGTPLTFLRTHPQFAQLRMMVQAQPELLQPLLQQLGQQNPELLQLINANQQEFIQLMNEPPTDGDAAPAPGGMPGMPPAQGNQIRVTPEEKEAIDRVRFCLFSPPPTPPLFLPLLSHLVCAVCLPLSLCSSKP